MPYIRLKDNRNTTIARYISQSPSGIVYNKSQATNFATAALARSYMIGAYPIRQIAVSGAFTSQEYQLEELGGPIEVLPGIVL